MKDTFVRDTVAAISVCLPPTGSGVSAAAARAGQDGPPPTCRVHQLILALRAAAAASDGRVRDLWGIAATHADAAVWLADDTAVSRELWTCAREAAALAAEEIRASRGAEPACR